MVAFMFCMYTCLRSGRQALVMAIIAKKFTSKVARKSVG